MTPLDAKELGNSKDMTAFSEIIPVDSDEQVPATIVESDPNAEDETKSFRFYKV